MVDVNVVLGKIKEMSTRVSNPRPQIPISVLASELFMSQELLSPAIMRLKKMRLIQHEKHSLAYLKLTLLGYTVTC